MGWQEEETVNPTIGLIGCGSIASQHAPGLEAAGACVKWACDLLPANARKMAERFGAEPTDDYRRILDDPAVDTVDVMTVSSTHREICLAAIEAGKAVICEKTLAENAEDALEIVKAAEARGTVFYTAYMKRFLPSVRKAKELLPELGQIMSTHIRVHQPWGDAFARDMKPGEQKKKPAEPSAIVRRYGGGVLVCGGSHILDLLCLFIGRPNHVFASMTEPSTRDHDVQAAALFYTDNGPCLFEALASPLKGVGYLKDGWDERIELNGVNGRLDVFSPHWNQGAEKASRLVHYDNTTKEEQVYDFDPVSAFVPELEFFLGQIAKGEQGEQSRRTGYDVDELIAHIERSAAEQHSVEINWKM